MHSLPRVTYERARELLSYDPETGLIHWKVRRGTAAEGAVAGTKQRDGRTSYLYIKVDGVMHSGHRLAWLLHYGEYPKHFIDHIDGDGLNNRIENLRDITRSQNQRNARRKVNNTSGVTGVYWCKGRNKWRAQVRLDGVMTHLGYFDSLEDAASARLSADKEHGFSERHGKADD